MQAGSEKCSEWRKRKEQTDYGVFREKLRTLLVKTRKLRLYFTTHVVQRSGVAASEVRT